MKLYIQKKEVRAGGMLQDAFVVVDETGFAVSVPMPSRYYANKVRQELVDELDDYEIGKGKLVIA